MRRFDGDRTDTDAIERKRQREMTDRVVDAKRNRVLGGEVLRSQTTGACVDGGAEHAVGDDPVLHDHRRRLSLVACGTENVVEPVVHDIGQ